MEYTEQSSGSIRLYLPVGDFNIDQFTILKKQTLEFNNTIVTYGILGESHFVSITHNGTTLHEICACTEARMDSPDRILIHDFLSNLHKIPLTVTYGPLTYTFSFEFMEWEQGTKRLHCLHEKAAPHSLTYIFPQGEHDPVNPVTEIHIDPQDGISVYSVHTYPNEQVMVFTESGFLLQP